MAQFLFSPLSDMLDGSVTILDRENKGVPVVLQSLSFQLQLFNGTYLGENNLFYFPLLFVTRSAEVTVTRFPERARAASQHASACVSIPQHTSAYLCIRRLVFQSGHALRVSMRQHTSAYLNIRRLVFQSGRALRARQQRYGL